MSEEQHFYPPTNQRSSGGGASMFIIFLGLVFMIGPSFLNSNVVSPASTMMLSIFGLAVLLIGTILYILTKLYLKTPANGAYVRTGMGGQKVIVDGGAIFIPMFHEKLFISLETMKLEVDRRDVDALTTQDRVRIDMKSEFYIRVNKTPDDIKTAATSLGSKGINPQSIISLVGDKLVSALRTVAAKKDLESLFSDRQGFAEEVQSIVSKDLSANGLLLESVTISKLDQTNYDKINVNNIFDAEGARTVAQKVNAALVEKNEIEQSAKVLIETKNLMTTEQTNELKIKQETSIADTNAKISKAKSEKEADASKFAAEQSRISKEAEISMEKQVGLKQVEREKEIETANIEKEQTLEQKRVEKEKTIETAQIEKEKTILERMAEKAQADTVKSNAEAGAKEAEQNVLTVTAKAEAARQKEVTVINQQAEAEKRKIDENTATDILAYKVTAAAQADMKAAEDKGVALTALARAEKDAAAFRAEGEKAIAMVPVEVNKAQVQVNAAQVEVTGKELQFKAQYSEVSIRLETNLASIAAHKEVGKAAAEAMGQALNQANINLWGDPGALKMMQEAFNQGQSKFIQLDALQGGNFTQVNREQAKDLVVAYMKGQKTAMEVMGTADNVSAEMKQLVSEFVKSGGGNTLAGIGLLAKFLTGKDANKEELDRLHQLYEQLNPTVNGGVVNGAKSIA
ncbi:MAG: hypothetical protein EOP49_03935 [Sphingobacteriales bacterium]|nr:MAG: hypothetical protein EOP49_03935 [Sphingobacteriales bacterium]